MEDLEHRNGAAIVPVLKGVGAAEHLEEEFAVLLATCERSSQLRMSAEDVSPFDKVVGDACCEVGRPLVEECHKSIEVSEGVGIVCSMSRRGDCYGNAVMESFFSTVKAGLADGFPSYGEAKMALFDYPDDPLVAGVDITRGGSDRCVTRSARI